jgi:hypothetical protein
MSFSHDFRSVGAALVAARPGGDKPRPYIPVSEGSVG